MLIASLVLAIVFIVIASGVLKLHPILSLLIAGFGFGLAAGFPAADLPGIITGGFGGTIGSVGPIILLGAVIGVFLERSGGAMRIAEGLLAAVGRRNVAPAMGGAGFAVSIPVFCDSGFIILSPLNRALSRAAGVSVTAGAMALALGLYAAHTMVPPTPGPVAAAELVGADLGRVLLFGLPVALVTAVAGIAFAMLAGRSVTPALGRDGPETEAEASVPLSAAPPIWLSMLPLVVPILLILLRSIAQFEGVPLGRGIVGEIIDVTGHPVVALAIGVVLALFLPRPFRLDMLSDSGWVGQAFRDCAIIILITGAGGAFGAVLRDSGVADALGGGAGALEFGVVGPLLIAAAIKTAQGSSTVAIITTAGLVAPLLPALGLDSETGKALAVVAIGAGAMAVSHVNDSFFWVVTRLTGLNLTQGLKLHSAGSALQALVAAMALATLQLATNTG